MAQRAAPASGTWLELELERAADPAPSVRVRARGSRGESPAPHVLDPATASADHLRRFAAAVREAAQRGRPLADTLRDDAQSLHRALFQGDLDRVAARLREAAAGAPLLLRLLLHDAELQEIPWEALCEPGSAMGFLGTAPHLAVARGVTTAEPWQPREVRGAVRVLVIAPQGGASLDLVRNALSARISTGEIEWLEPLGPAQARLPYLFERLRREPIPHVVHFLGHGRVERGEAALRLADDADGEASWLPAALLAQQLEASFRGFLRLVVLEACEGARPGAFASAAELLARAGADAVIAHLWPVRTDVARLASEQIYRVLAGAEQGGGDVARSLHEARRAILAGFEGSAEAFSPVLYLRGNDAVVFDFAGRKVAPPAPQRAAAGGDAATLHAVDPALERILRRPFSLLLGDRWKGERAAVDGFRDRLRGELAKLPDPVPVGLPMSALTQRFALRRGSDRLAAEFQKAFRRVAQSSPLLVALARRLGPGVHTTLLRSPLLELALAEHQPERTIYAIQPGDESTVVLRREAGAAAWEELEAPPASLELSRDLVVLRPYRGYTPEDVYTPPLLTEDDYLFGFRDLEGALPRDLADEILSAIGVRPALVVGLSIWTWHHRVLLQRLFGKRPMPRGSLCVIEPDDAERELWEKGASLPGKAGVAVLEMQADALAAALAAGGAP